MKHTELTSAQERIVQERLEIGSYESKHDVIDDALGRLIEDDIIESYDHDELRASLQRSREGFDRGGGIEIRDRDAFAEGVMRRALQRLEDRKVARAT